MDGTSMLECGGDGDEEFEYYSRNENKFRLASYNPASNPYTRIDDDNVCPRVKVGEEYYGFVNNISIVKKRKRS